jgi:hypothetical protein
MQRSNEQVLQDHEALRAIPPDERAAALVVSLIVDDQAPSVVLTLCSVAAKLSRYLPPDIRTIVAWHLSEILEELNVQRH